MCVTLNIEYFSFLWIEKDQPFQVIGMIQRYTVYRMIKIGDPIKMIMITQHVKIVGCSLNVFIPHSFQCDNHFSHQKSFPNSSHWIGLTKNGRIFPTTILNGKIRMRQNCFAFVLKFIRRSFSKNRNIWNEMNNMYRIDVLRVESWNEKK